jgi:hypothetical protein
MLQRLYPCRVHQPIAMKQPNDDGMSCEQITIEYRSNTKIAASKIARNKSADVREIWLGILVWPGLIDQQNADGNEGNALLDRNVYLRKIAKSKSCNGGLTTGQRNQSAIREMVLLPQRFPPPPALSPVPILI